MRSSKSRSRSKSNRPRTLGNIVNRVFDSSGPEGKVRGTPQQIIEKYLFLARDAQLSNDRVAAENFNQHAEHYTRMLGEAQREMAAEQDQQRRPADGYQGGQQQTYGGNGNQPPRDRSRDDRPETRPDQRADGRPDQRSENRTDHRHEQRDSAQDQQEPARPRAAAPEVIDLSAGAEDDNGLVDTPETRGNTPPQRHAEAAAPEPRQAEARSSEPRPSESRPSEPRSQEPRSQEPRTREPRRHEPRTPKAVAEKPAAEPVATEKAPAAKPVFRASARPAAKPAAPSESPAEVAVPEDAKAARRPRAPRKPKTDAGEDTPPAPAGPREAAE